MTRDNKGQFARRFYKRPMFWLMVVMAAIPLVGQLPGVNHYEGIADLVAPVVVYKAEAAEVVVTPSTIKEMKGDVLDRLAKCESGGNKDIAIVFDSNKVASVGTYQWQAHSFAFYWQKMTGEKLSERAAVTYALDDTKARKLAEYVIFDTDAGSEKDWVICSRNYSLTPLVEFIKKHDN